MATNKVNTLEKPDHETLVSRQEVKPQPTQKQPSETQQTDPSKFKKENTAGQNLEDLQTKERDYEPHSSASIRKTKNIPPEDANIHLAVDLIKSSNRLSKNTRDLLTPGLVKGIYAAEEKRNYWYKKAGEAVGIGDTVGRGQIGKDAYEHVEKKFPQELKKYMHQVNVNRLAEGKKFIQLDGDYEDNLDNPEVEDFFTPAYLAIRVGESQREGRSQEDVLKFGIGKYHGGLEMQLKAQDKLTKEQGLHFSQVEKVLMDTGAAERDLVKYTNEVIKFWK